MNTDTGRKVEKFEDLIAWQKARGLTLIIYQDSDVGWVESFGVAQDRLRDTHHP